MENCHHTSTIFILIPGKVQVNILESHKVQTIAYAFQPPYEFGHMGTNYNREKNGSKFQQYLSYASCDKTIKNSLCNVGLMLEMIMEQRIAQGCCSCQCQLL